MYNLNMMSEIIISTLIFILGAAFASFFNAQIYRIEKEMPWKDFFTSPSKCESCGKQLSFLELTPILGFLLSKGKCKDCDYKIPLLYPISELIMGISFLGLWIFQLHIVYWILVLMTYFLALYDAQYRGFPKVIMNAFLILAVLYFFVVLLLNDFNIVITGVYLAVPISLSIVIMNMIKKSFGGGDVLVILMLSLVLSWEQLLVTLWFSVIVGGAYSVVMLILKKLKRKDAIPFVPFIYLGLIISLFIADKLTFFFENINVLWYS
jgi:prepilin signal peptidase PulO-like enzyme (type II secretory pathway)